jgi:aminopeptidase
VADPRLDTLASLLCTYSMEVEPGQLVLVDGPAREAALMAAVTRQVTRMGAHPIVRPRLDSVDPLLLELGTDEQLEYVSMIERYEIDAPDRMLTIWADANTRAMSAVPDGRETIRRRAMRPVVDRFLEREGAGEIRWCGVSLPTAAQAQQAGMAVADYEAFVYNAGHLNDPDPVAHWRTVSARQAEVCERLSKVTELRIVAEDTDLTVDVGGRKWINADGHENFPDGEVFTSPDETKTQGHIRFSFDAPYGGREVGGVRLWFEDGVVVREEADRGAAFLKEMLDLDEGSRKLGEVAFGMNDEIQTATGSIAFDEKIGGTCHVALGLAFPLAGGTNQSALHWDMVCDLRDGGEVYGDGELLARNGKFL